MTFSELERQLSAQKVSFAYFFPGEEEYLKEQAVKKIAACFIGQNQFPNGLESISATEVDATEIIQRTQSLGMFAEQRVIVLKEAEALSTKGRKQILEYLDAPSQDVCLIICSAGLDKKTAFYKGLSEKIPTLVFNALKEPEAVKWAMSKAKERGINLTVSGAQTLIEISGNNLGILDKEIEKLEIYYSGNARSEVNPKEIMTLAGSSSEVESYELANAVCSMDLPGSLKAYERLLTAGEDPIRLVSAIYYQLEKLWKVFLLNARGMPVRQIAYSVMSHEYYVNQMIPESRRRDPKQYLSAMMELFSAEAKLKSGRGEPKTIVQQLIYKIASSK